ncbi:MAG: N-6 DNA methylase [Myxococcales bacterium]|nr:N-6 DNA methylase [Polyangiaceae bacterium]MDW8248382.1 N-6 DNA methylase [Myxococcales bacterium]
MNGRVALLREARRALLTIAQEQPTGTAEGRLGAARRALVQACFVRQAAELVPGASVPPAPRLTLNPFAEAPPEVFRDVGLLGALHEHLQEEADRRRRGAHYTTPAVVREVVAAALAPLIARCRTPEALLALRVGDPAMGAGIFLMEACVQLGARLSQLAGIHPGEARSLVARQCLYGVDLDELTVEVARHSLWLLAADPSLPLNFADEALRCGDALEGEALPLGGPLDALVGNPPWVSYVGRAAQPLAPERRASYARRFASFRGYRNLQALFVERCARELRPGGRLGLVLPSSMAELAGYAQARREHNRWCRCDEDLPDLGEDAFEGVFQPGMVLLSTRREGEGEADEGPWPLRRGDLDGETKILLEKLSGPPLPGHLFGERGVQSTREERRKLRQEPDEEHPVGLRCGGDIQAFSVRPPSYYAAVGSFGGKLEGGVWREVKVLIRQTARYPVAVRSDGIPFRNSLLAGFEDERYPGDFLVAYLNSTPIRWFHYLRHRDARAGIPQVKIGHLRGLPMPPPELVAPLARMGHELSKRNRGVSATEQVALDREVARAFRLTSEELARILNTPLAPRGG